MFSYEEISCCVIFGCIVVALHLPQANSKSAFAVSWKWIWCDVSAVQFQKPHMSATDSTVNWWTLKILCKLINVYCLKYYISQLYFFLVQFLERSSVMLWLAAEGQNSNLAESNGWRDSIIQLLGRMSERSQFIETSIWRIAGKTFYVKIHKDILI